MLILAVVACIRPLMSMLGLLQQIGQPAGSIIFTVAISVVWIAAAVLARVKQPVMTLMYTGIVYGILVILISAVLSPILTGELQGPVTNPFAIVSVLITNAIWGIVTGGIALAWMRAVKR
ncbi:MAG TPA: hypothetical protein DCK78_15190 [Paenibacillus lactis]|nr:hypothetical protein [Paenibacillus lactis]